MTKSINRKLILKHLLFWIVSSIILFRLFTISYSASKVDYFYTFLFQIPLVIVVILNYRLADKTLEKKKYFTYLIGFIVLLGMGILLHYIILDHLSDYIFPGYLFYSIYSKFELGQYIVAYLLISLFFKFSFDWYDIKEDQLQKERTQKNFLKAQLNPHFLFNCLNNIYGQTSIDAEKGRESIVKLSDALRYMLYKTDEDRVPLKGELEYLENYIELEKLRLESVEDVDINFQSNISEQRIAPLILLPFVENCFKHCDKTCPMIKIEIAVDKYNLEFSSQNNTLGKTQTEDGGVGLTNVKSRLDLLYNNRYNLVTQDTGESYSVTLKLNLDE